jgi:beta-glucosidase
MKIKGNLFIVLAVTCATKVFGQNPFLDRQAAAFADSLTKMALSELTLTEKIRQMAGPRSFYLRAASSMLSGKGICVTPIGKNRKRGIPAAWFTDGPRGIIHGKQTAFPVSIARAATWNPELERAIGEALGAEARGVGATLLGTPCMNILRHPSNGRAQESFGEDPFLTGRMALALAQGIQEKGVMACAKHFALNSVEDTRYFLDVRIDKRSLHEVYLPHFNYLAENGVASIMSAYNKVNGTYCGENAYLLDTVLRRQWGFRGFVHSDWDLGTRSTVPAIRAGMNVEMMVPRFYKERRVRQALAEGKITEAEIDRLIYPTLFTKWLFQSKYPITKKREKVSREMRLKHRELALKAAEEGLVLLKNEGKLLPISPMKSEKRTKIVLTGFLIDRKNDGDHGSSYARPPYVITPKKAFNESAKELGYDLVVVSPKRKNKLHRELLDADYAVVIAGYYHHEEGEYISRSGEAKKSTQKPSAVFMGYGGGGDRHPLTLKKRDEELIQAVTAVHSNVIVQVISGSAVIMESWKERVPAIMWSGYHGMEGARVLPRVLFGEVIPSGKLPFSIPYSEKDLPHFPVHSDTVTYGYYHGYTLLDKLERQAAFPFGFGLSYGKLVLNDIRTDKESYAEEDTIRVVCDVKNSGSVKGFEVIQVYVEKLDSQTERHRKVLRGFKKVWLEPNETARVSIPVLVSELKIYNPEEERWFLEKGKYRLWVGRSSGDPEFTTLEIEVE